MALLLLWLPMRVAATQLSIDSLKFRIETTKIDSVKVQSYIALSRAFANINMLTAMEYGRLALEIAENSGDTKLIVRSLRNLGVANFGIGLFDEATRNYYQLMEISRKSGDNNSTAVALINLGSIKLQSLEFRSALNNFEQVLRMREDKPDEDVVAITNLPQVYNNMGIAYENLGVYDSAQAFYEKALLIASGLPNQEQTQSMIYNNLGKNYQLKGDYDKALEALNKALNIRIKSGDKWGQAASYRNLGSFYIELNELDQALEHLYAGMALAKDLSNVPLLAHMSDRLFEIYYIDGQSDSALKYHVMLKNYNDEISMGETRKELTRLELTATFNEKAQQREAEIKRKEMHYLFTGILLSMLLIIVALFYYLSINRLKRLKLAQENLNLQASNLKLQNENLEKELELKNKELTTNIMYQIQKNELINDIAQRLLSHTPNFKKENQELIHNIIRDLGKTQNETVWDEFETRFHQVYDDFYQKLQQINPDLSPNERRLCAFLRLNMTTKEIASITGQSIRSIEVARTRLRKKIELTNSDKGLVEYLASL